jgi:hypothetical protein
METKKQLLKEQIYEDVLEDRRREARDRIEAQQQSDAEDQAQKKKRICFFSSNYAEEDD